MATEVERLIVRLEATQARFEKQLAAGNRAANRRARAIERRFDRMNRHIGGVTRRIGGALVAAFASRAALRSAKELVDASIRIENALKVAGLSGEELESVYRRLFAAAQQNRAPFEALTELYSRVSLVQNELSVSTEELLGFTDRIAQAIRISGKSSTEASGALLQLSQALGSGVVRAEEFNSIMEGALPIAQAAAAGLKEAGGSVSELRQLVIDGKVSSEAFFRAFVAGASTLEARLKSVEDTSKSAEQALVNALTRIAGEFNKSTGIGQDYTNAIIRLSDVINGLDVSGFIDKIGDAKDVFDEFLNDLGNADLFRILNELTGTVDESGNIVNLDVSNAEAEARSLEREIELLQAAIEKNTELGFDNSDALARLDEVSSRLSQVRAELSAMPKFVPPDASRFTNKASVSASIGPAQVSSQFMLDPVSLSDFAAPAKTGSSGGSRGGDGSRSRQNDLQREIQQIRERTIAIQAGITAQARINPLIDDYGFSLEKALTEQELLTAAQRAGIEVTPALRTQIEQLAGGYAQAVADAERLSESQDRIRQRAEDMRNAGRDALGGFIQDLRSGTSAADALSNALSRIADTLLNQVLDAAFQVNGAGGGGGILGTLLGGLFRSRAPIVAPAGIGLFANGGISDNGRSVTLPRYAKGGVSRSAAIFGEGRLPEAAVPLPDGRRIPVDLNMPSPAAAGVSRRQDIRVSFGVAVDDEGALQAYVKRVSGATALQTVTAAAPEIIDRSTSASGAALGRGDFDGAMRKYGATRQAKVR